MLTKTMKTMNLVKSKSQQIMKTIKSLTCLAAIALSFAACQKNESSVIEKSNSTFTFTSAKPQLEGETRTEYTGSSIQWSKGDVIRMAFTVDGVWQTENGDATVTEGKSDAKMYASTALSAATETAEFSIPNKFTTEAEGEYVFYTIYPSSASYESFTYAPSATVKILNEQTPSATSFATGADVMFGKSVEKYTSKPTAAIPLDWTRLVAHGDITLKGLQNTVEGETIASIKLTAQDGADLVGTHYFDVTTEVLTCPSSNTTANVLSIFGDNLSIDENGNVEFWMCILPETITSLKVEVETSKAFYTREITGISLAFAQNKRNTLSIKMDGVERVEKAPVTRVIEDGDYVIASGEKMMIAATSGNFQNVATLSTATDAEGKLVVDEDALWTITYDEENEVYYVLSASANKYLNGTATGTNLKLVADANKTGFSGTKNDDGTYSLTVTGSGTTRGIGYNYNDGNARFGMYNVTSSDFVTDLNLIPAVLDMTPSVTFAETSKTVSATTTEVSFAYTSKYLTATPEVSVVTDEDKIVSKAVVSGGVVTVTLNENTESKEKTATLTFSCEGVDDVELSVTQLAAASGESLTLDFENDSDAYSAVWTITNIASKKNTIDAHGGSYYGNTNGKESGTIQTVNKIANPGTLTFFVSKESTNTNASSVWKVSVSSDGSTWSQVGDNQAAAAGITKGTWTEVSRDLSSFSNVYVKIEYSGTSAVRCIDDISLGYN